MDDISALFLLRHRKSLHESLEINFKDDSQEFFMKASQIVDETGDVLKSVVGYTNAIKDEIVAIRDVVQSFLVNISNKMSTILSTSVQKYDDFTEPETKSDLEFKDTVFSQQKAHLLKEMEALAKQQQHLQEVAYSIADLLIGVEKGSLDVIDNLQKTLKVFAVWKNCIDGTEVSYNTKPGNDVAKNDTSSKEPVQQEPCKPQEDDCPKLEKEKSTLESQTKSQNEKEIILNSSDIIFKDEQENDTQNERKEKKQRDENEENEIRERTHESNFKATETNDVKPQTGLQVTNSNDVDEDQREESGGSAVEKRIQSMDNTKEKSRVIGQSKKNDKGLTKKQSTKIENGHKNKNKTKQILDTSKQERKVVSSPVAGQTNALSSSRTVHKQKTSKSTANNETSETSKSQQRAIKSRTPDNKIAETQENHTEGQQEDKKSKSAKSSLKADLQRTDTSDSHPEKRQTWIDLQRKKEEMEKKKEEKEKERRNPQNWPTYTYEREPNEHSFHKGICCVVSALPGFDRFCLTTKCSDHPQDLEIFLKDKEERVMSSVVTVTSTTRSQIDLELPLYIYIPCATNKQDQERELVLLMSQDGSPFHHATKLQPLNPPKKLTYLGTAVNNFTSLEMVVISRYVRSQFFVHPIGGDFEPTDDRNVLLRIPKDCFSCNTNIYFKVVDFQNLDLNERKLPNAQALTSLVGIEFDECLGKDVELELYPDTMISAEEASHVHQTTLKICKKTLVSNVSPTKFLERLQKSGLVEDNDAKEILIRIEEQTTEGSKMRQLLQLFKECSEKTYTKFLTCLEDISKETATILQKRQRNLKDKINMNLVLQDQSQKMVVLCRAENKGWDVLPTVRKEENPDAIFVTISKNKRQFQTIALLVPADKKDSELTSIGETLYNMSNETKVLVLVRQSPINFADVAVACTEPNSIPLAVEKLNSLGYTSDSTEMVEVGICDGEEIYFTTSGNIRILSPQTEIKLRFFQNFDVPVKEFKIVERDPQVQRFMRRYSGEVCFTVGSDSGTPHRTGSQTVYLSKPCVPLSTDVPLKAMAKYVSYEISSSGPANLEKFLDRLSSHPGKFITFRDRVSDRDTCELFILNWIENQRVSDQMVILKFLKILHSDWEPIALKTDEVLKLYSLNGVFSNTNITKIAKSIGSKWENLAKKLDVSETTIGETKSYFKEDSNRALHTLDQWRLSDKVIHSGAKAAKPLRSAMQACGCGEDILFFVSMLG